MQRSDQSGSGAGRRYLAVAQAVLMAIVRGDYAPCEQLPPDRELAARAGVSRPTARAALLALELIGAAVGMFVLVAAMYAVMAAAVRFGPETHGLSLEDVSEEVTPTRT